MEETKKTEDTKKAEGTKGKFDQKDIDSGKGMAVLSYILAPIPYFVEKKNPYVKYHAVQGMNLFIIAVAYSIINSILQSVIKVKCVNADLNAWFELAGETCRITPWWVTLPLALISIAISVFAIIGIVYAVQGKTKELPLIGKIKIIKK